MTCIVAVPTPEGGVIMGGDSAGVGGWDLTVRGDEKVFRRGPFVMGFTSSFRMGQLLRYKLNVPAQDAGVDDLEYMSTVFVDSVRECLAGGGWRKREDERESGGTFLVGYRGVVYCVQDDFQVARAAAGYDACGSGAQVALGALFATDNNGMEPEERVLVALDAAQALNAGVREPFVVLDSDSE